MGIINRFCVMAVLQAARAFLLGLKQEEAYSWGLNRAIFYAAAKKGFKGSSARTTEYRAAIERREEERPDVFRLGDEMALREEREGKLVFTIGNKPQTSEDFHRQIISRFGDTFDEVWREAIDLLKKYDRNILLSQKDFYSSIYKPNRDILAQRWSEIVERVPVGLDKAKKYRR